MHSLIANFLLSCIVQAQAEELLVDKLQLFDRLVDKLVDDLFQRVFKVPSLHHVGLDKTILGYPSIPLQRSDSHNCCEELFTQNSLAAPARLLPAKKGKTKGKGKGKRKGKENAMADSEDEGGDGEAAEEQADEQDGEEADGQDEEKDTTVDSTQKEGAMDTESAKKDGSNNVILNLIKKQLNDGESLPQPDLVGFRPFQAKPEVKFNRTSAPAVAVVGEPEPKRRETMYSFGPWDTDESTYMAKLKEVQRLRAERGVAIPPPNDVSSDTYESKLKELQRLQAEQQSNSSDTYEAKLKELEIYRERLREENLSPMRTNPERRTQSAQRFGFNRGGYPRQSRFDYDSPRQFRQDRFTPDYLRESRRYNLDDRRQSLQSRFSYRRAEHERQFEAAQSGPAPNFKAKELSDMNQWLKGPPIQDKATGNL